MGPVTMPTSRRPGVGTLLLRGCTRRCPWCGSRHVFRHWFTMKRECPRCGLVFEREEGFFLGALMINLGLTMGALLLVIALGFALTAPDTDAVKLALFAGAVGALTPVVLYPFSKTLWCAIDMVMRRTLGEQFSGDGTQPGVKR